MVDCEYGLQEVLVEEEDDILDSEIEVIESVNNDSNCQHIHTMVGIHDLSGLPVAFQYGWINNNNSNNRDDSYGAVIMAKPLREFTR